MKFNILLAVFIIGLLNMSLKGLANPTFYEEASLYEHLHTVNNRWEAQQFTSINGFDLETCASFASDKDRIQLHLALVEAELSKAKSNTYTPIQAQNRTTALAHLKSYYQNKIFPINHYHAERTPYFIDNKGTACAVGHLMIETGYKNLALQIHQENNYAYIKDLLSYDFLLQWAKKYGFTVAELAWIQPTYSNVGDDRIWGTVGMGTNNIVRAVYADNENDRIIMAGDFTSVDGLSCNGVAIYDGKNTTAIGNNLNGTFRTVTVYNNEIYVGGYFYGNTPGLLFNILKLDEASNTWIPLSIAMGIGEVFALHAFQNNLYAGGSFNGGIAQLVNENWQIVGSGVDSTVRCFTEHNNELIIGGDFNTNNSGTALNRIARLSNGNWEPLSNGLDNTVYGLTSHNGILYASGGFFNTAGATTFGFAHYSNNAWVSLLEVSNYAITPNTGRIKCLASSGNYVILGGDFNLDNDLTNSLALYNPLTGSLKGLASFSSWADVNLQTIALLGDQLFVGGDMAFIWRNDGTLEEVNNICYTNVAATQVHLKVLLEGAYDNTTNAMRTDLRSKNLLPLNQPYSGAPWFYAGDEAVANNNDLPVNMVDWVLVEVRSSDDVHTLLDSRAGILLSDGSVVDVNDGTALNFYNLPDNTSAYFLVRHRNHIDLLSELVYTLPTTVTIDFTRSFWVKGGETQLKLVAANTFAMVVGDFDANGAITVLDYNFYSTETALINQYLDGDANLDGNVTTLDYNLYSPNASVIGVAEIRY